MTDRVRLCFDVEADNLLPGITTIHCGVTYDIDREIIIEYVPTFVKTKPGQRWITQLPYDLSEADEIWGHNIISYDIPAIKKVMVDEALVLEKFVGGEGETVMDSMVLARTIWPDIKQMDFENLKKGILQLPNEPGATQKLVGSHSLRAWGYRLGYLKGNADGGVGFETYTPEMLQYCKRDVLLNVKLIQAMFKKEPTLENRPRTGYAYHLYLEHQFYRYLEYQQAFGVSFDVEFANLLCTHWNRELTRRVVEMRRLCPNIVTETLYTPKVNRPDLGYVKGETITKTKTVEFNPKSGDHVRDFLIKQYGWEPQSYTKPTKKFPKGQAEVNYEVLSNLPYKEAPLLARIRLLMDRLNLVKNGKTAWLNNLQVVRSPSGNEEHRIYGRIIHNGTNTARCRHMAPNLGNIPSTKAIWGPQLRKLFKASQGHTLVGVDFDGLEMRCLSELLWDYDGGAFYEMAFNGRKEDGTDAHSLNTKAINHLLAKKYPHVAETFTGKSGREKTKTIFYAWLYGAFPKKLGLTACLGMNIDPKQFYKIGELITAGLKSNIKGLDQLILDLESGYDQAVCSRQWPHLQMPDGRRVPIRKKSALLNSYLQAMGAILCKWACVRLMHRMEAEFGRDVIGSRWRMVLHVHDEIQNEVSNEDREFLTRFISVVTDSFRESGEYFGWRVPIVGSADTGPNWASTH